MPVAKKRADLAELISVAAVQRRKVAKHQRKRHSVHRIKRAISNEGHTNGSFLRKKIRNAINAVSFKIIKSSKSDTADESEPTGQSIEGEDELTLYLSAHIHYFLEHIAIRIFRIFIIILAFLTLSYEAVNTGSNGMDTVAITIDIIIDFFFAFEGALKFFAFYAHMDMHRVFNFKTNGYVLFFRKSGVMDMVIATASLLFARRRTGDWIRLFRVLLISSFALEEAPHLEVLLSGISFGLKSIVSTWLLLSLVFIIYASCALTFFQQNDPYHFGSIALSMWTFFELSTLDNWSTVMYTNMYGCDKFPSQYTMGNTSDLDHDGADYSYRLRYGRMILPVCYTPEAQPVLAFIVFVTFITLCGFILINITIAAVTAGINDRLDEIRKEDLENEMGLQRIGSQFSAVQTAQQNTTLLTNPDMLLLLMQQVWKEHDEYAKKMARLNTDEERREKNRQNRDRNRQLSMQATGASGPSGSALLTQDSQQESFDFDRDANNNETPKWGLHMLAWRYQSMFMRDLLGYKTYHLLVAGLVSLAAVTEMYALQTPESRDALDYVQLVFQLLFTIDIYIRVIATYPNYSIFTKNGWNVFDAVLVIVTWAPVLTMTVEGLGTKYIGLLRVLRILRLLKMLTWIPELNVILHSIGSSVRALVYVIMLMLAFFYHFGIAGIFLFAENDPQHFGSLLKAFVTLFQVSSLDDWSEIARTNMYGCDLYGYDTGEEYYDSQCTNPRGLGWIAAWYFIVVVVIGVMVLLSLFVGIIITSMELLKEGIKEEKEVWAKVRVKQKQYNMRDTTINNLLEIFDLIDIGQNGKLTLNELKPILEIVSISEANQFSLFMMVDNDSSGQIDFSEFLELIHLVGKAYKANAIKKLKKHKVLPGELKSMVDESKQQLQHHSKERRVSDPSVDDDDKGKGFMSMLSGAILSNPSRSISLSEPKIVPMSSYDEKSMGEAVHSLQNGPQVDSGFVPIDTEGNAFLDLCRNDTPKDSEKDSDGGVYAETPDKLKNRGYSKAMSDVSEGGEPSFVGHSFFEHEMQQPNRPLVDRSESDDDIYATAKDARVVSTVNHLFDSPQPSQKTDDSIHKFESGEDMSRAFKGGRESSSGRERKKKKKIILMETDEDSTIVVQDKACEDTHVDS